MIFPVSFPFQRFSFFSSPSNELKLYLAQKMSKNFLQSLVKRGEHMKAARMLIRVASSISHFPAR